MLSKRNREYRNEEKFRALTGLVEENFEQEHWNSFLEARVSKTLEEISGITVSELFDITPDVLLLKLQEREFDIQLYEKMGDLLFNISKVEPKHHIILSKQALKLYEKAQNDSDTYSVSLSGKIENLKS